MLMAFSAFEVAPAQGEEEPLCALPSFFFPSPSPRMHDKGKWRGEGALTSQGCVVCTYRSQIYTQEPSSHQRLVSMEPVHLA